MNIHGEAPRGIHSKLFTGVIVESRRERERERKKENEKEREREEERE